MTHGDTFSSSSRVSASAAASAAAGGGNEPTATRTPNSANQTQFFTEDELNTTSIRALYITRCQELKQTPNESLLKQLPSAKEDIDEVFTLDFRGGYFGRKGLDTIYPVIAACHRVVHLNLEGVGFDVGTVIPLLQILNKHPAVRELVLNKNRIGTETVLKLCTIAYSRGLLYKVDLDDAWVVDPLRKRLDKVLSNNLKSKMTVKLPLRRFEQKPAFDLIKEAPTPPPPLDPEDVPVRPSIADMAQQLRRIIIRHRNKMPDLQAMFRPLVPGVCSVRSFLKVAKLLDIDLTCNPGITAPLDNNNITVVAANISDSKRETKEAEQLRLSSNLIQDTSDAFGATLIVENERVVRFGRILAALRDHVFLVVPHRAEQRQEKEEGKEQKQEENNNNNNNNEAEDDDDDGEPHRLSCICKKCLHRDGHQHDHDEEEQDDHNNNNNDNKEKQQQQEEEKEEPAFDVVEVPREFRELLDSIFDSKTSILESCEIIDIDQNGTLCFDDFVAGIAASTQSERIVTEKLVAFWMESLSLIESSAVEEVSVKRTQQQEQQEKEEEERVHRLDCICKKCLEKEGHFDHQRDGSESEEAEKQRKQQEAAQLTATQAAAAASGDLVRATSHRGTLKERFRGLISVPYRTLLNSLELKANSALAGVDGEGVDEEWKKFTSRSLQSL